MYISYVSVKTFSGVIIPGAVLLWGEKVMQSSGKVEVLHWVCAVSSFRKGNFSQKYEKS